VLKCFAVETAAFAVAATYIWEYSRYHGSSENGEQGKTSEYTGEVSHIYIYIYIYI
jgi:hypothetical protein